MNRLLLISYASARLERTLGEGGNKKTPDSSGASPLSPLQPPALPTTNIVRRAQRCFTRSLSSWKRALQ